MNLLHQKAIIIIIMMGIGSKCFENKSTSKKTMPSKTTTLSTSTSQALSNKSIATTTMTSTASTRGSSTLPTTQAAKIHMQVTIISGTTDKLTLQVNSSGSNGNGTFCIKKSNDSGINNMKEDQCVNLPFTGISCAVIGCLSPGTMYDVSFRSNSANMYGTEITTPKVTESSPVSENSESSGKDSSAVNENSESSGKESSAVSENSGSSDQESSAVSENSESSDKDSSAVNENSGSSESSAVSENPESSGKDSSAVTKNPEPSVASTSKGSGCFIKPRDNSCGSVNDTKSNVLTVTSYTTNNFSFPTKPNKPSSVTKSTQNSTSITLKIVTPKGSGFDGFCVKYSHNACVNKTLQKGNNVVMNGLEAGTVYNFVMNGLEAGTVYNFLVYTIFHSLLSQEYMNFSAATQPKKPSSVTKSTQNSTSITLKIVTPKGSGFDGICVKYSHNACVNKTLQKGNNFVMNGLEAGTVYNFVMNGLQPGQVYNFRIYTVFYSLLSQDYANCSAAT